MGMFMAYSKFLLGIDLPCSSVSFEVNFINDNLIYKPLFIVDCNKTYNKLYLINCLKIIFRSFIDLNSEVKLGYN